MFCEFIIANPSWRMEVDIILETWAVCLSLVDLSASGELILLVLMLESDNTNV